METKSKFTDPADHLLGECRGVGVSGAPWRIKPLMTSDLVVDKECLQVYGYLLPAQRDKAHGPPPVTLGVSLAFNSWAEATQMRHLFHRSWIMHRMGAPLAMSRSFLGFSIPNSHPYPILTLEWILTVVTFSDDLNDKIPFFTLVD